MSNTFLHSKLRMAIIGCTLILFISATAKAQSVSGTVRSANNNQPLPGVTVHVGNSSQGTITNNRGYYQLSDVSPNDTLVFSFIGYERVSRVVGNVTKLNLKLVPAASSLDQIVVVGFGEKKKENVTGAISQISSDQIQTQTVNNTLDALQGLAPNLNINTNGTGGSSDATMNLNIRGVGSLSGSSPFILIDGVRSSQREFATLNSNNIKSISVLKGPAASAIYGSHGAFGVILVETKTGRKNEGFTVEYSDNFRFTQLINVPQSVNSVKYAEVGNQAAVNYGLAPIFSDDLINEMRDFISGKTSAQTEPLASNPSYWRGIEGGTSNGWKSGYANTNWWNLLFKKTKLVQKHNLSIRGGSKNVTYYVNGGMLFDPGQFKIGDKNEKYNRFNLTSNVSVDVTNWLTLTNISRFSEVYNKFPNSLSGKHQRGRLYHDINRFPPFTPYKTPPVKDDQGNVIVPSQYVLLAGWNENNGFNEYTTNNFVTVLRAKIDITNGLNITGNYNYKKNLYHNTFNYKAWNLLGPDGSIEVPYQKNNNQIFKEIDNTDYHSFDVEANYNQSFSGGHNINVMIGYQQEKRTENDLMVGRKDVIDNTLNSLNVAVGEIIGPTNPITPFASLGAFGRFQYNFKQKYIMEFDGRYDGSSKFAPDHRFVFSPSASIGYNIDKEKYWDPIRKIVNKFKLRLAYGTLGNQEVSSFLYVPGIPIHSQLGYVIGGEKPIYTTAPGIISPNITWETVKSSNIGGDFSFLDYRLTASADYYIRITNNMFGPSSALPSVLGTDPPKTNSASLKTKGWSLVLNWQDEVGQSIRYHITAQLSNNNTYITKFNNPNKVLSTYYVGEKLGEIWGYEDDGLFQTKKEVEDYLAKVNMDFLGTGWAPGDVKYKDLNKDGKIDEGDNTLGNSGDRRIIGNNHPQYNYSIQAGLSWKRLSFNMFWQGIGKRDVWMSNSNSVFWGWNKTAHTIITKASLDYWTQDNPDAYLPRPLARPGGAGFTKDRYPTPRYMQSGAYLRLKSLRIGYDIPNSLTDRLHLKSCRIYLNAENLLTITKMWPGFDPALAPGSNRSKSYSSPLNDGAYPLSRSFGVGIDVQF